MAVIWHVCSASKIRKYMATGSILPPVRAWTTIEEAGRFAVQTGRTVILRLKSNASFKILDGHKGMGVVSEQPYHIDKILNIP